MKLNRPRRDITTVPGTRKLHQAERVRDQHLCQNSHHQLILLLLCLQPKKNIIETPSSSTASSSVPQSNPLQELLHGHTYHPNRQYAISERKSKCRISYSSILYNWVHLLGRLKAKLENKISRFANTYLLHCVYINKIFVHITWQYYLARTLNWKIWGIELRI